MKQLDIELVRYEKLKHVKFLVNRIQHRNEHIHNEFEFFVVLRGEGVAKIKSHTYDIKQGDIYLINSGEVHAYARNPVSNIVLDRYILLAKGCNSRSTKAALSRMPWT